MDAHVKSNGQTDEERQEAGWLWNDPYGIDNGMEDPGNCCDPVEPNGGEYIWLHKHVHETGCEKRKDVLQVVAMGPGKDRRLKSGRKRG
jgi:hypothetical protein